MAAQQWREALAAGLGEQAARFERIVADIRRAGGRALAVGGWVRDFLRGEEPKDLDVEVYRLPPARLKSLLGAHGRVEEIGEAFAVLKLHGLEVDFSLPRRESKTGPGHRGFAVEADPELDPAAAARRRDLTINAIALDLGGGEIVDPFDGRADLAAGVLRATDPEHFGEDPLRVYRVAQFAARFEYAPAPELVELCAGMGPEGLAAERILGEFDKLLLKGRRPSLGLEFLRRCGWIKYHPELAALIDCPQEESWHPEGDVWTHTLLALDAAAGLRTGEREADRLLLYAALCHDLGKPATTARLDGRIRSIGHCQEGEEPTRSFLGRLTREADLVAGVVKLVREHLAPTYLHADEASAAAVRRLARRLAPEASIEILVRLARADFLGTGLAGDGEFKTAQWILDKARELAVQDQAEPPALLGRHLIAAGLEPGPAFGPLLEEAYRIQTEEGIKDPAVLLSRVRDKQ